MKIHSLFILNKGGQCLYSKQFTDELNFNSNLITPFFSAILSFSENLVSRKLEELEMSGLRFAFKIEGDFIIVILADTSVSLLFINSRLVRISAVFFKMYNQLGELRDFQEIDNPEFDASIEAIITGEEDKFRSPKFYDLILELYNSLIFENEIIGGALLSIKGNIIYTSLPDEILLSSMKEMEIRYMTRALTVPELFYSLENGQKVFSKSITVDKGQLIFMVVLLFESNVSLGMAEVQLHKLVNQLKNLLYIHAK